MLTTNTRYLDAQAELLASTVDAGDLAALARPVRVGARRVPGLKPEDDRVIRLLEGLLHPGTFVADWTAREVHARLLARHRLTEADYRLSQLRYDLGKLRAHRLVELQARRREAVASAGAEALDQAVRAELAQVIPELPQAVARLGQPMRASKRAW
ncbi:MAG TPA: hypothetical protein VHH34_20725, partial [Pseudonocardiaceae bacterium]|nr:hypothetical protein [Pseudonocardiaceae bacterium]